MNLVEVDLLRAGQRVAAAGPQVTSLPPFHYLVSVCRATDRRRAEVYPCTFRERLPRVGIPLRSPDADVVLDLPAAFARCYENADYALRLPYDRPPPPPALAPDEAEWLRQRLSDAGRT